MINFKLKPNITLISVYILISNQIIAQPVSWDASTSYPIGALVVVGSNTFIATETVPINNTPPNTTYWADLSEVASALKVPVEAVPKLDLRTILASLPSITHKLISSSLDQGDGWRNLPWFGNFFVLDDDWFVHEVLGAIYVTNISDENSTWFYTNQSDSNLSGWMWTSISVYPFIYSNTTSSWKHIDTTHGDVYDFLSREISPTFRKEGLPTPFNSKAKYSIEDLVTAPNNRNVFHEFDGKIAPLPNWHENLQVANDVQDFIIKEGKDEMPVLTYVVDESKEEARSVLSARGLEDNEIDILLKAMADANNWFAFPFAFPSSVEMNYDSLTYIYTAESLSWTKLSSALEGLSMPPEETPSLDISVVLASLPETIPLRKQLRVSSSGGGTVVVVENGFISFSVNSQLPQSRRFIEGKQLSLSASVDIGYIFKEWSGDIDGGSKQVDLSINSDKNITANFGMDLRDHDSDGLSNYHELVIHSTLVDNNDSDGDGFADGVEVNILGTSPNSPNSKLSVYIDNVYSSGVAFGKNKGIVEGKVAVRNAPSTYSLVTLTEHEQAISDSMTVGIAKGKTLVLDDFEDLLQNQDLNTSLYTTDWFYIPEQGWMWTNNSVFPWFYDHSSSSWLYFLSRNQQQYFYSYGTKEWITTE
jgi:hypothetical protein